MDCSAAFYPTEENIERKAKIGSTSLDASQDTIKTNKDDPQSVQEDVDTQTRKHKMGRNINIPSTPPNVTPMMQYVHLLLWT